jgi:hypothetical protein
MIEEVKRGRGRPKKVVDLGPGWDYTSTKLRREQLKNRDKQKQESVKLMKFHNPNFVANLAKCSEEQLKVLKATRASLGRYMADESMRPTLDSLSHIIQATEAFQASVARNPQGIWVEVDGATKTAGQPHVRQDVHHHAPHPAANTVDPTTELGPDDTFPIAPAKKPVPKGK